MQEMREGEDAQIRSAIRQHLKGFWPNSTLQSEKVPSGPIDKSIPGLEILRLSAQEANRPHIYVTNGCFMVEAAHVKREFFLISPKSTPEVTKMLIMLAHFHADPRYRLDIGRIVGIGDPWISGSTCDHFLISLPYPYGPKLEWLKLDLNCIRFLWALPITPREAAFAELNGYQALEEQFDKAAIDCLNIARASVI